MTIIYNQSLLEFDEDPALQECDKSQPIAVEASDCFVVLNQRDGCDDYSPHCILVEYRDIQALIDALQRCL